jgi:hypothetical protein
MAQITIDTAVLTGYRTFVASGLTIVFGLLAQTNWIDFLNNPKAGGVAIGMGILMALLRLITNTPPGVGPTKNLIQIAEPVEKTADEKNIENLKINIDKTLEL